ncbi:hypothetical protein ACXDF8_21605 [Mycolicibacterium sp. CBM1]
MPEPVTVDIGGVRALAQRLTYAADELATTLIPGVDGLPGSALAALDCPRHLGAEVARLGAAVHEWVRVIRHGADALIRTENANATRFRSP